MKSFKTNLHIFKVTWSKYKWTKVKRGIFRRFPKNYKVEVTGKKEGYDTNR